MKNKSWLLAAAVLICAGCADNSAVNPDFCPDNPDKIAPGFCGCDVADVDANNNGVIDCLEDFDYCPDDPDKKVPGVCGCGTAETDTDQDGHPDCVDKCPNDPQKTAPGLCGCGNSDSIDENKNGIPDCLDDIADLCPNDPNKTVPGICGCGVADVDSDQDGVYDCLDRCPNDPNKTTEGLCGCDQAEGDSDQDGLPDCVDECPNDANKIVKGLCGCGTPDDLIDSDYDGVIDCQDACPFNPRKTEAGPLGCDADDDDSDGIPNDEDVCPYNPNISDVPAGEDRDAFLKDHPFYCNIVEVDGTEVFQIWAATDFSDLNIYMHQNAEAHNKLGLNCQGQDSYCSQDGEPLICNDVLDTPSYYFKTWTSPKTCTCSVSEKDPKNPLPPACEASETLVDEPVVIAPENCDKDLLNQAVQGACCDADFKSADDDKQNAICFGNTVIIQKKSEGQPGEYCATPYQSADAQDGKILVCKEIEITDGKVVSNIGQLKEIAVSGGKAGESCDPYLYQESCTDDSHAKQCIHGVITDVECASQCTHFDSEALHVACIPNEAASGEKLKVQLMRDINLAEVIPTNIEMGITCNASVEWGKSLLYGADFDGQNHRVSFNSGNLTCNLDHALFSEIVDSSLHDLKLEANLTGTSNSVLADVVMNSSIKNIDITSNIDVTPDSSALHQGGYPTSSFGAVAGIAYNSEFSDISLKGNLFAHALRNAGILIGAAKNIILKDSSIDISNLIAEGDINLAFAGIGRNTASHVDVRVNSVRGDAIQGFSQTAADAYDVNVHIGDMTTGKYALTYASTTAPDIATEAIRFNSKIKFVYSDDYTSTFDSLDHAILNHVKIQYDTLFHGETRPLGSMATNSRFNDVDIQINKISHDFNQRVMPIENLSLSSVDQYTIHIPAVGVDSPIDPSIPQGKYEYRPREFSGLSYTMEDSKLNDIHVYMDDIVDAEHIYGVAFHVNNSSIDNAELHYGNLDHVHYITGFIRDENKSSADQIHLEYGDIIFSSTISLCGEYNKGSKLSNMTVSMKENSQIDQVTTVYAVRGVDNSTIDSVDISLGNITNSGTVQPIPNFESAEISNLAVTTGNISLCKSINSGSITDSKLSNITLTYGDITESTNVRGLAQTCSSMNPSEHTFDQIHINFANVDTANSFNGLCNLKEQILTNATIKADTISNSDNAILLGDKTAGARLNDLTVDIKNVKDNKSFAIGDMTETVISNSKISIDNVENTSTLLVIPSGIMNSLETSSIRVNTVNNGGQINSVTTDGFSIQNSTIEFGKIANTNAVFGLGDLSSAKIDGLDLHYGAVEAENIHSIARRTKGSVISNTTVKLDEAKTLHFDAIIAALDVLELNNLAHYADVRLVSFITDSEGNQVENDTSLSAGFIDDASASILKLNNLVVMTRLGEINENSAVMGWLGKIPAIAKLVKEVSTSNTFVLGRPEICDEVQCDPGVDAVLFPSDQTKDIVTALNEALNDRDRKWVPVDISEKNKNNSSDLVTIPWLSDERVEFPHPSVDPENPETPVDQEDEPNPADDINA